MTAGGKVAVVTGAAGGVGRAAAERLVNAGWNVVAADVDTSRLRWTASTAVVGCGADVASEQGNSELVATAMTLFGRLDGVILNAALSLHGSIDDLPMSDFDRMLAVNVRGIALGIRASLPALRESGGGSISITSSTHGLAGDVGSWAYSATKHAVIGIAKSVAREVALQAIRVNVVCPGPIRGTGMSQPIEDDLPEAYAAVAAAVPLGRWAEADEIAAVHEFLLSDASSFMTGVAIPVDGGAIAGSGLSGHGPSPTSNQPSNETKVP